MYPVEEAMTSYFLKSKFGEVCMTPEFSLGYRQNPSPVVTGGYLPLGKALDSRVSSGVLVRVIWN